MPDRAKDSKLSNAKGTATWSGMFVCVCVCVLANVNERQWLSTDEITREPFMMRNSTSNYQHVMTVKSVIVLEMRYEQTRKTKGGRATTRSSQLYTHNASRTSEKAALDGKTLYTHTHTQQTGKSKSVEGNRKLSYKPDADTSEWRY